VGRIAAVQSNDGWYGGGAQTAQHRSMSVLRAIENRVSVVHAINDGQSHVVSPSGRYLLVGDGWTRAQYVADVPPRSLRARTVFNGNPRLLIMLSWVLIGALAVLRCRERWLSHRRCV